MSSISCAGNPCGRIEASRIPIDGPWVSSAGLRNIAHLYAVVLTAAALAGCAQSSAVSNKSELLGSTRVGSTGDIRKEPIVAIKRVAVTRKHTPFSADKHVTEMPVASYGIASFYVDGEQTASGEKFDPHDLTAAHRTLPFGTRLRVTNVATGHSVTLRVNDRGPFIPGRVVDVSYSAAETLGIVGRGVAKVKLDVVQ